VHHTQKVKNATGFEQRGHIYLWIHTNSTGYNNLTEIWRDQRRAVL